MFDTVVRGGRVVTPDGVRDADIAIAGGSIVRIGPHGAQLEAARTIDASGLIVLPGGIDAHVHAPPTGLGPVPEPPSRAGANAMGRAALLGGTTTLIDFAYSRAEMTLARAIEAKEDDWRDAPCDHAFHVLLRDDLDETQLAELPDLVARGHPSFKVFMTNGHPSRGQRLRLDVGRIAAALGRIAPAGGILTVHGEDDELVRAAYAERERDGRTALAEIPSVRSALAEELAFGQVLTLARRTKGAVLYLMHVTSREGAALIRDAHERGEAVYGEVLHNYLVFDSSAYARPDGALYHTFPSLRASEHREALVAAAIAGDLSVVATDASFGTTRERKLSGRTLVDVRGGHAGIQTRLAVTYTELVHRRGLSLVEFAKRVASAPARLFGLTTKGAVAVGMDADLVLLDPSVRRALRADELVEADYSIWDGYAVAAWPRSVLLRGMLAMEEGRITDAVRGRSIPGRRLDDAVRAGAV